MSSYTSKLLINILKLSKLGNIIRVEILILNFSIKYGLKIVSKTKMLANSNKEMQIKGDKQLIDLTSSVEFLAT